jgi:hypothetical protein
MDVIKALGIADAALQHDLPKSRIVAGVQIIRVRAPLRPAGGMITAPMLSMLVLPVAYLLIHRRGLTPIPSR